MSRHIDTYSPGDRLPNGAILIDKTQVLTDTWVVLALHPGAGAFHPFCTWRSDAEGNTWHGHYLESFSEASHDYHLRVDLPGRRRYPIYRSAA